MSQPVDAIAAASAALDVGRPEDALELLGECEEDSPDRWLIDGEARLELGDLPAANAALERARACLDADDPDLLFLEGEVRLAEWRLDGARGAFERLAGIERTATVLERLSLCFDLESDFEGADRLLREANVLDPESVLVPTRLDDAAFDAVVGQAMSELPDRFRSALDNTRIVTEPVPFRELVLPADPAATPPDLFGLFTGPTLHELAEDQGVEMPPCIYLFQRNLERHARDPEHLCQEIRTTLYHEVAHLLGYDEDEVDAMGLG